MTAIEMSDARRTRAPEEVVHLAYEVRTLRWTRWTSLVIGFALGGALVVMLFQGSDRATDLRTMTGLATVGALTVAFFTGRCLTLLGRVNNLERRLAILERRVAT